MTGDAHEHEHGHNHAHDHDHAQTFQPDLEEQPLTYYKVMTEALGELLVEKGVISADELRGQVEQQDSLEPALGARLIARAWCDDGYRERLIADLNAAATELDIDAGDIPIRAIPNTPEVHNLIVCTLCSCYPRSLIGLPPDWYKSRAYRSRVVREPRVVLREFGTELPASVEVRVHDSTADLRYLVLPMRPEGTEGMDEAALVGLVGRDAMIGVTLVAGERN